MAYRIYVVEDYPIMAELLTEILTHAGYEVVSAANGLEALQRMRRQTPDLVVLDIGMPIMDGLALARRLQQDPWLARIPVIFLTAFGTFPSEVEAYAAGANDFVTKPFEMTELVARVRASLRRCKVEDSPERDVIHAGDCSLDVSSGLFEGDDRSVQLTAIEADLLRRLMLSPGQPVSAQQLLIEVLDYPPDAGDPSLIRWHIRNLRRKIELDPAHPVHLQTSAARGYCFN